jgi:hypothetical protein
MPEATPSGISKIVLTDQAGTPYALTGGGTASGYPVSGYGAVGDGVTDDTAAIQSAITAAISAGGGVISFPRGNYRITSALLVNCGSSTVSIQLAGSGKLTTKITQATVGADIFVCGVNTAENCDFLRISDFTFSGGRYALRLNNCLHGSFERLNISGPTVGIYFEGQNESHIFRDIEIVSASQNGILSGQLNGGSAVGPMNLPIMQKCLFEKIRVAQTAGGQAILVTAGNLGGQKSSGQNILRKILLESNSKDGIEVAQSFNTVLEMVTTEDTLDTTNVYSGIRLGTSAGIVSIRDCMLQGTCANTRKFKYGIEVADGSALIERCLLGGGGAAGTADLYFNGFGTVLDTYISNFASLVFAVAARAKTTLVNVRDSAGTLIASNLAESWLALAYGPSIAVDASLANEFDITASNTTAFTINNPTNLVVGQKLIFTVRNTSGGVLGVLSWGTNYKLATWTSPATGFNRSITFRYDGTSLHEVSRTPADVPN